MIRLVRHTLAALLACSALLPAARGQDRPAPLDVLNLDVSVNSEITPDLAVVILSATREGGDPGALSQDVDQILAHAIADAKATAGVQAASGGYNTVPRFDNQGTRTGWLVRAELILKSHDFATLGKLVGKLTAANGGLLVVSSGFEVSPEVRANEENDLIERGLAAFRARAAQASKALGYSAYVIREVSLGQAQVQGVQRPIVPRMMAAKSISEPAAMPIESPRVSMQLTVHGSVIMHH